MSAYFTLDAASMDKLQRDLLSKKVRWPRGMSPEGQRSEMRKLIAANVRVLASQKATELDSETVY